jgi:FkbM family methyltransferase
MRPLKTYLPLGWRKTAKVIRAKAFESAGSYRYSHPALNGLDRLMADILPLRGVFLEVGANDGYSQSNTYFLEVARGWSGILIEPLPSLFARCVRLRKRSSCFNVACVAPESSGAPIIVVDQDLMSVTIGQQPRAEEQRRLRAHSSNTVSVATATLSAIIEQTDYDHVDFMSIDVEGAELSLLRGLDFDRHSPSWALIETAHPDDVAALCAPWLVFEKQLSYHDYLFRGSARSPGPRTPGA